MNDCSYRRRLVGVVMPAVGLLLAVAMAAPSFASAATPTPFPFGCRASGARVTLGTATIVEPIVANGGTTPCQTDIAASGTIAIPTNSPILTVGPIGAFTDRTGTPTVAPGAAATSDVQAVNIPTSGGTLTIVGPVQADAAYQCTDGKLTSSAQSTLDVIYFNGSKISLPAPGAPAKLTLAPDVFVALNQQYTTANSITERVLEVKLAGLADVVVGEATVTKSSADPCAGTTGAGPIGTTPGSGTGVGPSVCPAGSTLDVAAGACVIVYQGKTIYISQPFKGPSGGVVIALGAARKKYKSPCLFGPGPNYVLVATKRGGRVQGTPHSDRILARGAFERVAGLAGNDCIDGSGGSQKLFDGNGNNRIYGGGGTNRIGAGNGNNYINGRGGRDWITAGNGNDIVYGGRLTGRIDVGLGRDRVYGGPNSNRIWAIGDNAKISCGSGKRNHAFVRLNASAYAKQHGCQKITVLKK
jgi:hypothetical protein